MLSKLFFTKATCTLILALLAAITPALADWPFREHRFHHFSTLAPEAGRIVFIGNSITNMHEWGEAFGSSLVLNRGIAGTVCDELVENLEPFIINHPAKVFLMAGTNDLGTSGMNYPEYPAQRIRKIIRRIQQESPTTEIYVQSILPSRNGLRTPDNIIATNKLIAGICQELGATYVDLYSKMVQSNGSMSSTYTYDDLHCSAVAYAAWCKIIEDYVGFPSAYPANTTNKNNGVSGVYGMRLTSFAQLPVTEDDILMFGDEVQHGGEWAELLGNSHVKSRGAGWGYPGPNISMLQSYYNNMLKGRTDNKAPKKIFIYAGTADLNAGSTVKTVAGQYENLVANIKKAVPTTDIYIEALLPNSSSSTNSGLYVPFNDSLRSIAKRQGATFVDTYTPMVTGNSQRAEYFSGNYLNGIGYAAMAEVLAAHVGDCAPLTVEQARKNLALNNARNALGTMLSQIDDLHFGNSVGNYPESMRANLETPVAAAYAELAKGSNATVEALQAQQSTLQNALNAILPSIVQPTASKEGEDHWYNLCATLRGGHYLHVDGGKLVGASNSNTKRMMWKFVERPDGTLDIVSRADGSYISPTAAYNKQLTTTDSQPSSGWTLKHSSTPGMFIVTSGKVELNQTNLSGLPIYNWSSGQSGNDITDAGCQFTIEEVTTEPTEEITDDTPGLVTNADDIVTGWYRIVSSQNAPFTGYYAAGELKGRFVYNGEDEYRQNANNSYPLFMQSQAAIPQSDDATYYIRVERSGSNLFVRSTNGHYVQKNATATRTASYATPFSYDTTDQSFGIGAYWVYFPSLDNILGMSSGTAFAVNRFKVIAVTPDDEGLTPWSVSISGAPSASEVRSDVRLTCTSSALSGIKRVYNGGHFFLKAGTTPTASDFTADAVSGKQAYITIDADAHAIKVVYDLPNAVSTPTSTLAPSPAYDLLGRPAVEGRKGIRISRQGKILK